MVQIIPRAQSTFGEQVASGLNKGMEHGADFGKMFLKNSLDRKTQAEKLKGEHKADSENYNKIKDAFGEKFADVWLATGQGERTLLTKAALEARSRGIDLDKMLGFSERQGGGSNENEMEQIQNLQAQQQNPEESVYQELKNTLSTQNEGLIPSEKVARGKERYSTGLKEYQEAGTKLRNMKMDKERLAILENLNKSQKLPKNLERLNVDKEGNLKLPYLAAPESQRYVKTLNEFSAGAKDTFGSRVTNFDLAQYMKRYPTLLNTSEGRKQLLDQMKIVNEINSVYYKNLKNIYDRAGGVRNIDSDVADRMAEQLSESKVNKLSEKFNQIGQFSSKPAASEFKGKRIKDKETGEVFVSDGENWIPE
jgi:hypothetical protein